LSNKGKKEWKRTKNEKNKPWTLVCTLVFQTGALFFAFFFVWANWFSFQNGGLQAKSQFELFWSSILV
jgi:hypothetical protein